MQRLNFLIVLIIASISVNSQAVFILDSIPETTPVEDYIYMAGDFNGWNPGDVNHRLYKNDNNKWETFLEGFPNGITLEYKFTRGDWGTVEKGQDGEEIPNRQFTFGNGDTLYLTIHNWADMNPGPSTAAENVHILDESFWMPQLQRDRRIWIYLPPDYEESTVSYPVIYMHDGQNLFDQKTSYAGEWEVDETLNELAVQGYNVPIVVGIDNGGALRIDELTPWPSEWGGGEGDEYLAFIVETLKPYVDENYRTLPGRENTGIIGSSLGGLISTYGALKYQEVFGKSGPFSPAYWINYDSIWGFVSDVGMQADIYFYQNAGEHEGTNYINIMNQMEDSLIALGFENITSNVIAGGDHNEQTWRNDFDDAYLWLFASYALISELENPKPLFIYPNPATSSVTFKGVELDPDDQVMLMDISGRIHKTVTGSDTIEINELPAGVYMIRIDIDNDNYVGRFVKQ